MSARTAVKGAGLVPFVAILGLAQTQVGLRTQSNDVDFASATSTRPLQTGTELPATCAVGQMFFKSDASAGQNLYACTATNTWTVEAGAGSSGLSHCPVQRTQATVLTIFPNASLTNPCIFGRGTTSSLITSPATVTSSAGTTLVYISVGAGGAISVGAGSATVVCSGCTATSASAFPSDAEPVWTWTLLNGTFDPTGGTDFRAMLSYKPSPSGGRGISVTAGDKDSISTDATVIPVKFSGSGTPASVSNATLGDTYVDTASGDVYVCNNGASNCSGVGAGQWVRVGGVFSQWDVDLKPVACNFAGTSAVLWDTPNSSTPATFECRDLGEKVVGYATFTNTGSPAGIVHYTIPRQWTSGGVSVYLEIFGNSSGGAAGFTIESYCVGVGSSILEPFTWTAAASTTSATLSSAATVFEVGVSSLSMTGCGGGSTQYLRIKRDNTVTGNLADSVSVLGSHVVFN
ncbi:MAG: hypothetical protein ACRD5L_00675 [Bryobacteraceae bacterium]